MAGGRKCAKNEYKVQEFFSEFLKIVLMRPQAKMQNGRRFSLKYTVFCDNCKICVS